MTPSASVPKRARPTPTGSSTSSLATSTTDVGGADVVVTISATLVVGSMTTNDDVAETVVVGAAAAAPLVVVLLVLVVGVDSATVGEVFTGRRTDASSRTMRAVPRRQLRRLRLRQGRRRR